ncbi:aldehyde dehydrogenase [Paramyrothecium foliicola]|nr:aldehyde dehydrogenase [Paramyrothecium foliicola]
MARSEFTPPATQFNFESFFNTINGRPQTTASTTCGINPSTLEKNPAVPVSTRTDVDKAVEAAQNAVDKWQSVPYAERQVALRRFADSLEELAEGFANMLTREQGKPLNVARGEVAGGIEVLRQQAQIELPEDVIEDKPGRKVIVKYKPIGIVAGIVPWNFPFLLSLLKIGSALLTGNALILKPSPFTPYCGLKLVELAQQHFPPGVLQALSGNDDLGPWLVNHPHIGKVSFTGSTATGKRIMQDSAKTLKRVTLELFVTFSLGGNDPAIICSNVDVKDIAPKMCVAIKRLYAHEAIYEDLITEMAKVVDGWVVADGFQENATLGPLSNKMQFDKVNDLLDDIKTKGYKIVTKSHQSHSAGKGYFITPTIVDNPPDDSRVVQEEAFGPVLPVLRWSDEEEVIKRANDTLYGLGASVWSQDKAEALRIVNQLRAGAVWINGHAEQSGNYPVSGHKESGIGSESGLEGFKSYCNVQTLVLKD